MNEREVKKKEFEGSLETIEGNKLVESIKNWLEENTNKVYVIRSLILLNKKEKTVKLTYEYIEREANERNWDKEFLDFYHSKPNFRDTP